MSRQMNPLNKEELNTLTEAYDARAKRSEEELQDYINKKLESGEFIIKDGKMYNARFIKEV